MARNRRRKPGGRSFLQLYHDMLDHANFATLSPRATKLLLDIASQYRGSNNGDLVATSSRLKSRAWNSNDQIRKGVIELEQRGFIVKTRQGRRPKVANLYALTWLPIDECRGKLEIRSTDKPSHLWKRNPPEKHAKSVSDYRVAVQPTPSHGAIAPENVVTLHRAEVQLAKK